MSANTNPGGLMLLTDDQRAALEFVLDHGEIGHDAHEETIAAMLDDAADARLRATPCPHVTGRTTQWCALGQTTAEVDRALVDAVLAAGAAREAMWGSPTDNALEAAYEKALRTVHAAIAAVKADRARELAPEGQDA